MTDVVLQVRQWRWGNVTGALYLKKENKMEIDGIYKLPHGGIIKEVITSKAEYLSFTFAGAGEITVGVIRGDDGLPKLIVRDETLYFDNLSIEQKEEYFEFDNNDKWRLNGVTMELLYDHFVSMINRVREKAKKEEEARLTPGALQLKKEAIKFCDDFINGTNTSSYLELILKDNGENLASLMSEMIRQQKR